MTAISVITLALAVAACIGVYAVHRRLDDHLRISRSAFGRPIEHYEDPLR